MAKMHLIGWGDVEAQPAENVKVGDILMWNYGSKSEVVSVDKITAKSITIIERCSNGKLYQRMMRKNRLVCIL